jgi:hypothetical protein
MTKIEEAFLDLSLVSNILGMSDKLFIESCSSIWGARVLIESVSDQSYRLTRLY